MKALSFTRPWTELILSGVKDVENRTWPTPYRGLLVVHGAKSWDPSARVLFDELVGELPEDADRYCPRDKAAAPTGFLGVVTVTDCHAAGTLACQPPAEIAEWCDTCSPWAFAFRNFHWRLTGACRFPEPIPGNGRLGLFDPPPEVLAAAMTARDALTG